MIEHTHYEFAGLVQRKTKAGKCNMDEHVLFNQKRKQTDLDWQSACARPNEGSD